MAFLLDLTVDGAGSATAGSYLLPQVDCLSPEAICNGHFALDSPVFFKLQGFKPCIVYFSAVSALLTLVLFHLYKYALQEQHTYCLNFCD